MSELLTEWADRTPARQIWIAMLLTIHAGSMGFITLKVLSLEGAPPSEARELARMFKIMAYLPPVIVFGMPVVEMAAVRAFPSLGVSNAE